MAKAQSADKQSIQEWFSSGQRVSVRFFSSLLDAEGRNQFVSCHLFEPDTNPDGAQPEPAPSPSAVAEAVLRDPPLSPSKSPAASTLSPQHSRKKSLVPAVECITFLHGYPTSSYDYYQVVQRLRRNPEIKMKILLIDMLGYGDSDKGVGEARFSIQQHANVVCSIWQRYDIKSSHLVVHDFSVSVAQELLYREPKGRLPITLHKLFWLNGSVFIDLYRPTFLQRLCSNLPTSPPQWLLSQLLNQAVTESFSKDHPPSQKQLEDMQFALFHRGGAKIHHKLVRFMKDRARYKYLWQGALELAMRNDADRMMFYWGMQDPLSGSHLAAEIHRRYDKYGLRMEERRDLGHWPHLEDPRGVADALAEFLLEPWEPKRQSWFRDHLDVSTKSGSAYQVSVQNGVVQSSGFMPAVRRRSQSADCSRKSTEVERRSPWTSATPMTALDPVRERPSLPTATPAADNNSGGAAVPVVSLAD